MLQSAQLLEESTWGKLLDISFDNDKWLISKTYKKLTQLNSKHTQQQQQPQVILFFKWTQELNRYFFTEDTQIAIGT